MKIFIRETKLNIKSRTMLARINGILEDYQSQGYTLTLRQLYYQLVSADVIPNNDKEYDKIGRLLKEGRLAGLVDWDAIEDRLRKVRKVATWDSPKSILESALYSYKLDRNKKQDQYVEVWVEKEALSEIVEKAARAYQVPVMVNRGYGSISMMKDAFDRITNRYNYYSATDTTILYLGDHDPSGLNMVEDIRNRMELFLGSEELEHTLDVKHIAITREQINEYNPPPNPAKLTDSRGKKYVAKHGPYSWEVDALEPRVLSQLISEEIEDVIDMEIYKKQAKKEEKHKAKIKKFIEKLSKK